MREPFFEMNDTYFGSKFCQVNTNIIKECFGIGDNIFYAIKGDCICRTIPYSTCLQLITDEVYQSDRAINFRDYS